MGSALFPIATAVVLASARAGGIVWSRTSIVEEWPLCYLADTKSWSVSDLLVKILVYLLAGLIPAWAMARGTSRELRVARVRNRLRRRECWKCGYPRAANLPKCSECGAFEMTCLPRWRVALPGIAGVTVTLGGLVTGLSFAIDTWTSFTLRKPSYAVLSPLGCRVGDVLLESQDITQRVWTLRSKVWEVEARLSTRVRLLDDGSIEIQADLITIGGWPYTQSVCYREYRESLRSVMGGSCSSPIDRLILDPPSLIDQSPEVKMLFQDILCLFDHDRSDHRFGRMAEISRTYRWTTPEGARVVGVSLAGVWLMALLLSVNGSRRLRY